MAGGYSFYTTAHLLSSRIFIGLLFSYLMFSKQADEEVAPNLIQYLVSFSIRELHY